ncbi:MAG: serine hydrolase domain-containing protein [Chloroflexota bacterium]
MKSPESVGFSAERLTRIETAVSPYIGPTQLAGAVTLVARRGEIVHLDTYGYQDRETETPMTTDSIFRIYSMTKPIACVAAMTLYEQGRFLLTDPVAKFIPAFNDLKVYAGSNGDNIQLEPLASPVTIQQLFTHTAGLSYHFTEYGPVEQMYRDAGIFVAKTLEEFVDAAVKLPLAFQPGTHWRYSIGHDILARLVEIISDQSFDGYLQEQIFAPLGMVDTGFYVPEEKHGRFTSMYGSVTIDHPDTSFTRWFGDAMAGVNQKLADASDSRESQPHTLLRGGSGLVSTAMDYWRFCQMMLNNGELNGIRILGRKTVELMRANHLSSSLLPYEIGHVPMLGYGFGIGMRVLQDVGLAAIPGSTGEYGWAGAANTYFWIDPVEELIGVFMSQYQPSGLITASSAFRVATYQAIVD